MSSQNILANIFESLFYFPKSSIESTPKNHGLKYLDFFITTSDKNRLNLWHIKSKKPTQGIIIQAHGNAHNMSSHFKFLTWATDHGYDLITFDYRGYGRSSGKPERQGMIRDCTEVISYVCKKNPKIPTHIIAQSLGGALMIPALSKHPSCIKKVIIESSFLSYQSIAQNKLYGPSLILYPLTYFLPSTKPLSMSPDLSFLIFHGTNDPVVPLIEGKNLFKALKTSKKQWVKIKTDQHLGALEQKKYQMMVLNFLKTSP